MTDPVIRCTQQQLAFVAWQCKRAGMTTDTKDLDLNKDGPAGKVFRAWWDRTVRPAAFASLKDLIRQAWIDAPCERPLHADYFEHWWKVVVLDAQPT